MRWALALVLVSMTSCIEPAVVQAPVVDVTPSASPSGPTPAVFDGGPVMETIELLVRGGPREATSAAFRRAARAVAARFEALGYAVRREAFPVPRGVSWGVPVRAGRTRNVIAEPPGFDPSADHLIVGAHLDTVPQAPGANDNAAGVAIVLELARLAAAEPPGLPVVFIAFGAEEPRGPRDDQHHYGSAHHASGLTTAQRRAVRGVLVIDRVGAGRRALICTGGRSPVSLRDVLLRAAERLDHPARRCDNRTSDHWPFEKRGFTVARLDGGRFDGYHSARDTVDRLDRQQLGRVGEIAWEALRTVRASDL